MISYIFPFTKIGILDIICVGQCLAHLFYPNIKNVIVGKKNIMRKTY